MQIYLLTAEIAVYGESLIEFRSRFALQTEARAFLLAFFFYLSGDCRWFWVYWRGTSYTAIFFLCHTYGAGSLCCGFIYEILKLLNWNFIDGRPYVFSTRILPFVWMFIFVFYFCWKRFQVFNLTIIWFTMYIIVHLVQMLISIPDFGNLSKTWNSKKVIPRHKRIYFTY